VFSKVVVWFLMVNESIMFNLFKMDKILMQIFTGSTLKLERTLEPLENLVHSMVIFWGVEHGIGP